MLTERHVVVVVVVQMGRHSQGSQGLLGQGGQQAVVLQGTQSLKSNSQRTNALTYSTIQTFDEYGAARSAVMVGKGPLTAVDEVSLLSPSDLLCTFSSCPPIVCTAPQALRPGALDVRAVT